MLKKIREKHDSHSFLLMVTIILFIVMYLIGIIVFQKKNFGKFQVFLNLFISNAGLIVAAVGMTIVLLIGGTLLTGGVGNVIGSLFGVLIKGTIETFISFQGSLSSWWAKIAIAVLLAFFIILQSIVAANTNKKK